MSPLLLLLLPPAPALAALEVISSQLVSRLPDGLGPVVAADLDSDGDRDLLVTGRRNDFLGWIESTSAGPAGALRPIDTGAIPVAGQRPMVANLDGGAFADLHFPGWKIPVSFRQFGAPEPHPASAGHEFMAAQGSLIVARSTATGEWVRITPEGVMPLSPDGAILRSDKSPAAGQVHFGDANGDSNLDLLVVMDGVTRNGTPISPGLYWQPLTATFPQVPPRMITSSVPRLVTPVHDTHVPSRIKGVIMGFDSILIDDGPPVTREIPVTTIRLHWPRASEWDSWGNRFVVNVGPGATDIAAFPTGNIESVSLEVSAPDPAWGTDSLRRYHFNNNTATELGVHLLSEAGSCGIHLLGTSGSRLLTFSSTETTTGAETIRRLDAGDLIDTLPGDSFDTLPLAGRLVAGPFGTLVHASWQDLADDGTPELIAATDACEAVLRFDSAAPQFPKSLTALATPSYRLPGRLGPPVCGDLDGDGDADLARSAASAMWYDAQFHSVWENLGGNEFWFSSSDEYYSPAASEGFEAFRIDQEAASNRPRILFSKPGVVTAEWFTPLPEDPWQRPTLYPGTGARVVAADHDIDGDGHLDFVFYPSVFGNALAWGKWNPGGGHLDSLDFVASAPAGAVIPSLKSGDLDGDGTPDLFHPVLDAAGRQVTWVAGRLAAGTLTSIVHPPVVLPEPATHVLPLDLDSDGDIDLLRFHADAAGGSRPHEVRWTEYLGGLWVHHDTDLGTLRTAASLPEPVPFKEPVVAGDRTLLVNRIGEILEIRTRVTPPGTAVAAFLASRGITGASAGDGDDPDGDGIPNYAEILAGSSPLVPDASLSIAMLASAPNHGWVASLAVAPEAIGARARLETSDDLNRWDRHADEPLPLGEAGGRHRYLFSDPALASPPARRFARIVFTRE